MYKVYIFSKLSMKLPSIIFFFSISEVYKTFGLKKLPIFFLNFEIGKTIISICLKASMLTVYLTTSTNQLYKLSLKTINVELIKSLKKQIILLVVYQSFLKDFFC